ncbi:eukaryotic translation initiation factor family member protein [Theileria equi strain WA]|uniref:Eukaryotic translation initiation factor family member protein n=1 Tax=Theileria equi strain WA TaxID=1537102 RepID=L1L9B1_THEEQ|nr:eukaryotic translation initiation factor family member protein [Theileria equi strain WA]EKX72086.1 eukaryotic translation initiation factor family member protein [Theileria equi strain WA]|eukprot:XP_004831538.1 eukaryotic translation initiation factor family member protein [Theileria equi strain WA]
MRLFRRSKAPEAAQQGGQPADKRGDKVLEKGHMEAHPKKVTTSAFSKGKRGSQDLIDASQDENSGKQTRPWNLVVSNKPWNPKNGDGGTKPADGGMNANYGGAKRTDETGQRTDTIKHKRVPESDEPLDKKTEFRKHMTESTATGHTGPSITHSGEEWDVTLSIEQGERYQQPGDAVPREKTSFSARRNESGRQDKVQALRNAESARKYEPASDYIKGEEDVSKKGTTYQRGKFKRPEFRQRYESPKDVKKNVESSKTVNRAQASSRNDAEIARSSESDDAEGKEVKTGEPEKEEDFPRTKDFVYKPAIVVEQEVEKKDKNMDLVHQDALGDSGAVQDYKGRITKGKPFYPPKAVLSPSEKATAHSEEHTGSQAQQAATHSTSNVYVHHDEYKPSEHGPRRKREAAQVGEPDYRFVNQYHIPKHAEYTYPVEQEYPQYGTLPPIDTSFGVQYVRSLPGPFIPPERASKDVMNADTVDGQAVARPKIKPRKSAALQILNPETGEVVNSETRKEQRKTPKPPESAQGPVWQYNPYVNPYARHVQVPQYPPQELFGYYYLPHEIPDVGGFTFLDKDASIAEPIDGVHMPIQFPLQRRSSIESKGSIGHKGQATSSNSGSVDIDGAASDMSLEGSDASKTLFISPSNMMKYAQVMQNQHTAMAGQYAIYKSLHVRIKNKPIAPSESLFTLSEQHPLTSRSTARRRAKVVNEALPSTPTVEHDDQGSEVPVDTAAQSEESLGEAQAPVADTETPELPTEDVQPEEGPEEESEDEDDEKENESIDILLRYAFSMEICAPEELGFFKLVPLNYQAESPREPKSAKSKKKKSEKWRSDPPPGEQKKAKMSKEEQFTRTVRTLLNKLTVEKFLTVGEKVALVYQELDSSALVDILVRLLHEKATTEIDYSDMYADLALLLKYKFNDALDIGFRTTCFQRTLLNRCQDAFEEIARTCKSPSESAAAGTEEDPSLPSKNWVLGNIRFMGELFLRKILSIAILKRIFSTLLCKDQVPSEHLMECFTELLTTIGFTMEKIPGGSEMLDEYMKVLLGLRTSGVYSTRISFKIQDLMDLRTKNWKKKLFREKATTVDEIHTQAKVEELKGGSIHAEQEGRFTTAGLRADRHYSAHLQTLREQAQSLLVDGVYKGPTGGQSVAPASSAVPPTAPPAVGPPSGQTVDLWEDVLEIFTKRPSREVFVQEWKKIGVQENDKPRIFRLMCQKATYASTLEVSCALAELAALVITTLTESQATLHKLVDTLSIQFLERLQDEMLDNPRALVIFSRILIALFCECSNRRELLEMLIFPQDEQLAQELAEEVIKGVKERNGDVAFATKVIDKVKVQV